MTLDHGDMDAIATVIAEHGHNTAAPLIRRIEALEESQKNFRYVGVWESGRAYKFSNFCTDRGALWHCQRDATTSRPGDDGDAWRLVVKAPR
jgi:hypothetical protein